MEVIVVGVGSSHLILTLLYDIGHYYGKAFRLSFENAVYHITAREIGGKISFIPIIKIEVPF